MLLELNEDGNEREKNKLDKEDVYKFKEEIIEEWSQSLRKIGSKEVYDAAIGNTKNKELLYALKSDLLNDNPDDDPKVKELAIHRWCDYKAYLIGCKGIHTDFSF